jgi:hypothetical protein
MFRIYSYQNCCKHGDMNYFDNFDIQERIKLLDLCRTKLVR